jgi:hypothetical protein
VILADAQEANFWANRRSSLATRRVTQDTDLAFGSPLIPAASVSRVSGANLNGQPLGAAPSRALDPRLKAVPLQDAVVQRAQAPIGRGGAPLVVLLQDIHRHDEAQNRIVSILQSLIADASLRGERLAIGVEGAFDRLHYDRFRSIGEPVLSTVRDFLFRRHEMVAATRVALGDTGPAADFVGIDDATDHAASVAAFLDARPSVPALRERLKHSRMDARAAVLRLTNVRLRTFIESASAYHRGELPIASYLTVLDGLRAAGRVSETESVESELVLEQFLTAARIEARLDFARVERERRALVDALSKRVSADEVRLLSDLAVGFRSGRMSYGDYFGALKDFLTRKGVAFERWPAFAEYLSYVALSDALAPEELFAALGRLETRLGQQLAASGTERALWRTVRRLDLAEKLVDFSLTPEDWLLWNQTAREPKADGAPSVDVGVLIDARLGPFVRFYELADRRSRVMAARIAAVAVPRREGPSVVAVAGGFHSALLSEELRARGLAVAVVRPRLNAVEGATGLEYLSYFGHEKTPVERLFAGEKLYLSPKESEFRPHFLVLAAQGLFNLGLAVPPAAGFSVDPLSETRFRFRDESGVEMFLATEGGALAMESPFGPLRVLKETSSGP